MLKPVTVAPESCEAVQVNVLPLTVEDKETFGEVPPQIVWAAPDPTGIGFTVMVAVVTFPKQPFATGVIE